MMDFPTWDASVAPALGAVLFAILVGKATKSETRTLMACLIVAVLTGLWYAVIACTLICLCFVLFDIVKSA